LVGLGDIDAAGDKILNKDIDGRDRGSSSYRDHGRAGRVIGSPFGS